MRTANTVEVRVGADINPLRQGLRAGRQEVGSFVQGVGSQMQGATQQVRGLGAELKQGLVQGVGMGVTNQVFAGIAKGAQAAKGAIIDFNNTLEQFSIGLETLVGDGQKATAFLQQLKQFAKTTPFNFADVQDGTRRLLAMGFAAEEIIPVMRAVGNQVAGVGTGKVGLDRVSLALGQMSAKTKVSAEEMRQLTEAGVPAWTLLGKAIGKTEAEVMKMAENGQIAGDTMVKAFVDTYGAMDLMTRQSKTFSGALSNVQDSLQFALADIGKGAFDALTRGMNAFAGALESRQFQLWASVAKDAIAGIGTALESIGQRFKPFTDQIKAAFNAFTEGDVTAGMAHLGAAVKVVLDGMVNLVKGYVRGMFGAGANLMSSFAQGIIGGGLAAVRGAITTVANLIAGFFIGHSPPPDGPLRQITDGGKRLMEEYISGMAGGVSGVGGIAASVMDAMGGVSGSLTMDQARAGIAGARGDLKGLEAQATLVEGAVRSIDRAITENELAQKGVKLAIDDTKRAYDGVLQPLQKQIEAVKNEGAERTRMLDITGRLMDVQDRLAGADQRRADLIQKQSDLMSRQVDIQGRMALLDARQAVAASKGDPFARAQLLAQIDSVRVRQDELSTVKELEDIEKRLTEVKEKGKGKDAKEPEGLSAAERAGLEAKREELRLQQQLQGLVNKPAFAQANAAEKQLQAQSDLQQVAAEQSRAQQDQLKIQAELAGIPRERAKIEFDVVRALDEQARISREIMAIPLEQLAAALKQEQEAQLEPLQAQADALGRQGDLLATLRSQWQDIASTAKDAASAIKEAQAAEKEGAAGGPGAGGTKDPNRIVKEAIEGVQNDIEAEFKERGQRLSENLQQGFAQWTQANFGQLAGSAIGSALGLLTFGPMGAVVGSLIGKEIGAGVQAQVPDLGTRVSAAFTQVQNEGLIPTIQAWWPAIQPVLQQMGASLFAWIGEQSPGILAQLQAWGVQFKDWVGPALAELMNELGRQLEPVMQYLKDQAPTIGKAIAVWTVEFVTWAGAAGAAIVKRFGEWLEAEGLPGMAAIGGGLITGIAAGLKEKRGEIDAALTFVLREAVKGSLRALNVPEGIAESVVNGIGGGLAGLGQAGVANAAAAESVAANGLQRRATSSFPDNALSRAVKEGFQASSERGPGSPGSMAYSEGEFLAQQLAAGLANGNLEVAKAIGVIVKTAIDTGIDPLVAVATSKAESELNTMAAKVDAKEASFGLWQHNTRGGQGTGIPQHLLQDPAFSTRKFLGQHAPLFQQLAAKGLTGRDLAMEWGSKAEVSDPAYKHRYGTAYDQVVAAIGSQQGNTGQQVQRVAAAPLRAINQKDLVGLSAEDAAAACGPAAAITFANAVGRFPNHQEAMQLARQSGWSLAGMGGPANFQKLTSALGLKTDMDWSPTGGEIDAQLAQGRPVAISTPRHYYTATGGTAAGGLNVGGSGMAFGGKEVMTLQEIASKGEGLQATITLLDEVRTAGASVGPILSELMGGFGGLADVAVQQVDPALQAMQQLLSAEVPAAGFATGDAVQKMAGAIGPLFNDVANGVTDMDGLKRKLVELAAQSGVTAGPLQLLEDGTIGIDSAMDKVMATLAASNPAFAALDQQVQELGISGNNLGNLVLQGLANATGVAGQAVLQMGQNIAPLIQQTSAGSIAGDELSRTLVTMAANAGVTTVPMRQLADGLTTADQALSQVMLSVADVSPEFRALYDEVQQGGQVTDAVRRQFLNLLEAYSKNQLAVKATEETQAGLVPSTTTTWGEVLGVTQESLNQAVAITQGGMAQIVSAVSASAEPAREAAAAVGNAIIDGIREVVEAGAAKIASAAAAVVKKALSAARSAGGGKDDDDDDKKSSVNTKTLGFTAFAQGGVIREPILGVGQRTGDRYLMGEAGPEVILPLSEASKHWEFAKGSKKKKNEPEPVAQSTSKPSKIPAELQGAAESAKKMMADINSMGTEEARRAFSELEAAYKRVFPIINGIRDNDKEIAKLKYEQAQAARDLLPLQNAITDAQKRLEALQKGTVADQVKGVDLRAQDLALSNQEIVARAQLRAEFPPQLALQKQIQQSQVESAQLTVREAAARAQLQAETAPMVELDKQIAQQRLKQAMFDQQMIGPRAQLRTIEKEIAAAQREAPDIQKAAIDQETSRNRVSLEALTLQRQIRDLEKAGFQGTVDEQVAQQYSANLLRDKLRTLEEQGTDMDEIAQLQQLQGDIADADSRKRQVDLEELRFQQQTQIEDATQALADQLVPLDAARAVLEAQRVIREQTVMGPITAEREAMDAQTAILQAQQGLIDANKALREAELLGPITEARQALQDQQTTLQNTLDLQSIGAQKDLIYLQDKLALQSKGLDAIDRQLAGLQAQQATMQALLGIVTAINQQITAAGLVPDDAPQQVQQAVEQSNDKKKKKKKKALGGPVGAGDLLLVGERGPELFIPPDDGYIAPYAQGRMLARAGGGGDTYHITVVVEGSVSTERDLVASVRAGLLKTQTRNVVGGLN